MQRRLVFGSGPEVVWNRVQYSVPTFGVLCHGGLVNQVHPGLIVTILTNIVLAMLLAAPSEIGSCNIYCTDATSFLIDTPLPRLQALVFLDRVS